MNANTIKKLQHLQGKVCSIVTTSMNRTFDERISREHFVVRVQDVGPDGIWGTHPYNDDMISFYAMPHIISVHTEVELDPTNPEHAELIKEYEKKTGKKVTPDLGKLPKDKPKTAELSVIEKTPALEADIAASSAGDATFVDIASLERLAESTRRTFEAHDMLTKK